MSQTKLNESLYNSRVLGDVEGDNTQISIQLNHTDRHIVFEIKIKSC